MNNLEENYCWPFNSSFSSEENEDMNKLEFGEPAENDSEDINDFGNDIDELKEKDTYKEKEIPLSPQSGISDTKITTYSSNSLNNSSSTTEHESNSKTYEPISESEIKKRLKLENIKKKEELHLNFEQFDKEGLENVKYECKIGNYDNDGIRKQYKEDYNKNILGKKTKRTVQGRRKKSGDKERGRGLKDCYSNDNMIISIKSTVAGDLVNFFNNKGLNLKSIDYSKFQKEFKMKKNLEFINGPVYKILSLDISKRNKNTPVNYNHKIIYNIINNPGNEEIKYLLNMTLHEFMDIIRHNNEELEEKEIFKNVIRIEEILNKQIEKKKGIDLNKYITKYLMLFYNYERYYYCKTARKF